MYSTTYLADTNVISELFRPGPDSGVLHWADELDTLTISAITIEEIAFGFSWHPNPRSQAALDAFIQERCQVLPVTTEIAQVAGQLRGRFQARGQARTPADMLIAATAFVHRLTMVTRNTRHFEDCMIALLNPFGVDVEADE